MGERKVTNKYYPPDFDPSRIPRIRKPKDQQAVTRWMLPMSIRWKTCGKYIYRGTKFNAREENAIVEILRFYFKCSNCSAEISVKTDPQNADYAVELGATRNFEPWCAGDEKFDDERMQWEEEMGNLIKSWENRMLDSKRDMNILTALDELKSMKSRHAIVSANATLEALQCSSSEKERLEEEDERVIRSIVFHHSKDFIRRIYDDGEDEDKIHPSSRAGEWKSEGSKRMKVSGGFSHATTDSLTAHRLSDGTSKSGNQSGLQNTGVVASSVLTQQVHHLTDHLL